MKFIFELKLSYLFFNTIFKKTPYSYTFNFFKDMWQNLQLQIKWDFYKKNLFLKNPHQMIFSARQQTVYTMRKVEVGQLQQHLRAFCTVYNINHMKTTKSTLHPLKNTI